MANAPSKDQQKLVIELERNQYQVQFSLQIVEKTTIETTDIVSFEPHEWKKISSEPTVYEALNDETVLKFSNYKKTEDDEEKMQIFYKFVFKKGESVEVSLSGTKFKVSFDNRESRNGERMDFDMEL